MFIFVMEKAVIWFVARVHSLCTGIGFSLHNSGSQSYNRLLLLSYWSWDFWGIMLLEFLTGKIVYLWHSGRKKSSSSMQHHLPFLLDFRDSQGLQGKVQVEQVSICHLVWCFCFICRTFPVMLSSNTFIWSLTFSPKLVRIAWCSK